MLCYVGSLSAYEAECRGEKPGAVLLSIGYNLGAGAPGVYLAHKTLPRSRALAEMVRVPPIGGVFFGIAIAIAVLGELI
jgi:hypothetical protein